MDPTSQTRQCLADWPQATLWKSKNQTVTWFSDDGQQYTVDFTKGKKGSPFSESTFTVPKNGGKPSGDLQKSSDYYDYAIWVGGGAGDPNSKVCKQPDDPGIYVKP
jgi:hypothetical protein